MGGPLEFANALGVAMLLTYLGVFLAVGGVDRELLAANAFGSALVLLCGFGLLVLYSATNQDWGQLQRQMMRLGLAFGVGLHLLVDEVGDDETEDAEGAEEADSKGT